MPAPDIPDLSTKQLQALVVLAQHGSFTTAAAALELSRPALSRAVQRLERQLGIALFIRSTRRVKITAEGREIVAVAERVLGDLEAALANRPTGGANQRGQIIVSTHPAYAHDMVPRLVKRLRADWRNIVVHVRHGGTDQVADDVARGIADLGVGFVASPPDLVECIHMRPDPLVVLLPRKHRLSGRGAGEIALDELNGEDLICLEHRDHVQRVIDGSAAQLGLAMRQVVIAAGAEDVVQLVRVGAGAAVLPASVVPRRRDFVVLPIKRPALSLMLGVLRLRGRTLTPFSEKLLGLCVDYLKMLAPGRRSRASRARVA